MSEVAFGLALSLLQTEATLLERIDRIHVGHDEKGEKRRRGGSSEAQESEERAEDRGGSVETQRSSRTHTSVSRLSWVIIVIRLSLNHSSGAESRRTNIHDSLDGPARLLALNHKSAGSGVPRPGWKSQSRVDPDIRCENPPAALAPSSLQRLSMRSVERAPFMDRGPACVIATTEDARLQA